MTHGTRVTFKDRAAQVLASVDQSVENLRKSPQRVVTVLLALYLAMLFGALAVYSLLPAPSKEAEKQVEALSAVLPPLFHAGLAFALLVVLSAVYRLTHREHVHLYSLAYISLLALYIYLALRHLPEHWILHDLVQFPPTVHLVLLELLSFGSTISAALAALDLMGYNVKQRGTKVWGLGALVGVLVLHFGIEYISRMARIFESHEVADLALLPGGVLSLLSLWLFGWAVSARVRPKGRLKDSLIPLGTFGIYGLFQPAIPFLQNPWLGLMLQTGTSVFKALCAGVVIYNVLREIWQEKGEQYEATQRARDAAQSARDAAQSARDLLESILDRTHHGFFRTDRDGLILDLNTAEARILGYDKPEEVKQRVNRLEVIADRKEAVELRQRLLSGGGGGQSSVQPIRQPTGATVYVRTYGLPAQDHSRLEEQGFQGIDHDVTEERRQERQRESEYILQAKMSEALDQPSIEAYFAHILGTIAKHAHAEAGALLLSGVDSRRGTSFLSVQSVFGDSPLWRGMVLSPANYPPLAAFFSGTEDKEDPSTHSNILNVLLPSKRREIRLSLLPLQTLQLRHLGWVWLAVPNASLPDDTNPEGAGFFLARAATAYLLAWRPEIDRLRGKVHEFLTVSGETSQRLAALENGLRRELNVDTARVAISLGNPERPQVSDGQSIPEGPRLLETIEAHPDTPQQALHYNAWQAGTDLPPPIYTELLLPIFNSRKDVIGSLLLCNPRTAEGRPSACSDLDLELLTEVTETIGGIAQTWISLRDQIRRLDTAAHELRSPALAIRNTADVLLKNYKAYSPESIYRKLEYIFADAQILVHQANALDALADRALARKPREILLFREVILKTVRQLKPLVTNVEFDHRGAYIIPSLMLNEEDASQITFNLVSNAFKYAKRGAPPKLSVEGERKTVALNRNPATEFFVIRFRDYGIGVPLGWEERIFEPEVRAPNGEAHEVKGMGLGLFVSRKLARGLGGDLRLTKHQNPTEFSWYLPASLAIRKETA